MYQQTRLRGQVLLPVYSPWSIDNNHPDHLPQHLSQASHMTLKILALGGDGIGPEVVDAALRVLDVAARSISLKFDLSEDLLHGAATTSFAAT